MSNEKKIGELNGKWSILFRVVLACSIPALIGFFTWSWWVTVLLLQYGFEINRGMSDRLTGTMFIEVQSELEDRNPDNQWLKAKEIRDIQERNLPYNQRHDP